jgi:hypothetical protein
LKNLCLIYSGIKANQQSVVLIKLIQDKYAKPAEGNSAPGGTGPRRDSKVDAGPATALPLEGEQTGLTSEEATERAEVNRDAISARLYCKYVPRRNSAHIIAMISQ